MGDDDHQTTAVLLAQYDQTQRHLEYFMDWRHKIMLRSAAILGGALLIAQWLHDNDDTVPRKTTAGALWAGAALILLTALMERRNAQLIRHLRERLLVIEGELGGALRVFRHAYTEPDSPLDWAARYEHLVQWMNVLVVAGLVFGGIGALRGWF